MVALCNGSKGILDKQQVKDRKNKCEPRYKVHNFIHEAGLRVVAIQLTILAGKNRQTVP
jgi:hypothetical protein